MSDISSSDTHRLRVIQCFRAPLGGLFRHVCDLTRGLAERGVDVAILCDDSDRGELEGGRLLALEPICRLGVHRVRIPRKPGLRDLVPVLKVARLAGELGADIIHGHGAKGGAYARLAALAGRARPAYTPHGGSLHDQGTRAASEVHLLAERALGRLGGAVVFESAYASRVYGAKVGRAPEISRVIHNGVAREEFAPLQPAPDRADVVFVGEFRALKGINVLVDALAIVSSHRPVTALLVGSGAEEDAVRQQIVDAGLADRVRIHAPMPARAAFARARLMVVASLAESLPYVVLEAGAAGLPMVATDVGGIPEVFGPESGRLIKPGDPQSLAAAIGRALDDPESAQADAARLRERIAAHFSVEKMVESIIDVYRGLLERKSAKVAPALAGPPA